MVKDFSSLISYSKTYDQKKSGMLVIIPFFKEYGCLFTHLRYLSRQTNQDFNAIVVMDPVSDEKKITDLLEQDKFKFGIILAKMIEPIGPAGAFFTGQKYALENGYQHMIFADVDCYPVQNNLMETLAEKRNYDVVLPKAHMYVNDVKIAESKNINYYGMVASRIVKKIGLYYYPIFIGGDDTEYSQRIRSQKKDWLLLDVTVEHRGSSVDIFPYCFSRPYYVLHGILFNKPEVSQLLFFFSAFGGCIFFQKNLRESYIEVLKRMLYFSYGKEAIEILRPNLENKILSFNELTDKNVEVLKIGDSRLLSEQFRSEGMLNFISKLFHLPFLIFRKAIIVQKIESLHLFAFASIFSKTVYYEVEKSDKLILIADNQDPLIHLSKMLFFFLFFPFFMLFFPAAFYIARKLKHPQTMGFGL